jgi:hypothetical protein
MKTLKKIFAGNKKYTAGFDKRILKNPVTVGLIVTLFFASNVIGTDAREIREMVAPIEDQVDEAVIREEILWFARAIYSETKTLEEQVMVAWVIRNRVESERFPDSYEKVVRQPKQFSGLNPGDKQYWVNITRQYGESGPGWDSALEVAEAVYWAKPIFRSFSKEVTHFYSPRSIAYTPSWAVDIEPAHVVLASDKKSIRFAFYGDIK